MRPPGQLIQLCIWTGGLGILDIDTQLNSIKIIKDALVKLNRQARILRSIRYENLQKQNN